MDIDEIRMQVMAHEIHQQYMKSTVDKMNADVREIKRVVFQVKWGIFGFILYALASQFGLLNMVKGLF